MASDTLGWVFNELLLQNLVFFILGGLVFALSYFIKKFGLIYQIFHKVDKASNKHGGEIVADVLKAHDVKFVFTLVGGHISPLLVASEKLGIRVIDTRHEVTAVFAADAVARLSGSIGVAAVTAGPGLTNTITAVKNAQMAESPLLLIGGAAPTLLKDRGALQDIDQMCLFKPLCKYCARVTRVRDIAPVMREAIAVAQSGTPGPVFVELPIDVLYPYYIVAKELSSSGGKPGGKSKSIVQRIVDWYLNNHLCNLFAGAFEECDLSPLPVFHPKATQDQVQSCIEIIRRSKKPVIIMGSQSMLPPTDANDLKQMLEQMAIPCFLGGMARGLLGRDSHIHVRQNRKAALKEADAVLLIGSVCDFRLGYGKVLPKRGKIIAVNRTKSQLYKNSDMFWKPTVAVQADPAEFLVSLAKGLGKGYSCPENWTQQLKEGDVTKETANRQKANETTDIHLNPLKVLYELEDALPENSILVADGGDFVGSAAYIVRPRGPLKWLDPGAFGTLGVGGGFALGAKLVRPECEVWVIYGDGSLGYSVAEFDTFTRHNVPVLALVGNDACWSQISRDQVTFFGSNVACGLEFTDYHKVAEGYGGHGLVLGRGDDIGATLRKAQTLCKESQKPVLVNTLIGKTNFREGSISV